MIGKSIEVRMFYTYSNWGILAYWSGVAHSGVACSGSAELKNPIFITSSWFSSANSKHSFSLVISNITTTLGGGGGSSGAMTWNRFVLNRRLREEKNLYEYLFCSQREEEFAGGAFRQITCRCPTAWHFRWNFRDLRFDFFSVLRGFLLHFFYPPVFGRYANSKRYRI